MAWLALAFLFGFLPLVLWLDRGSSPGAIDRKVKKVFENQLCEMEFLRTIDKLGIEISDQHVKFVKMRHIMEQHAARMGR